MAMHGLKEKIIEIWGKIKEKHEEYWLWQKEWFGWSDYEMMWYAFLKGMLVVFLLWWIF